MPRRRPTTSAPPANRTPQKIFPWDIARNELEERNGELRGNLETRRLANSHQRSVAPNTPNEVLLPNPTDRDIDQVAAIFERLENGESRPLYACQNLLASYPYDNLCTPDPNPDDLAIYSVGVTVGRETYPLLWHKPDWKKKITLSKKTKPPIEDTTENLSSDSLDTSNNNSDSDDEEPVLRPLKRLPKRSQNTMSRSTSSSDASRKAQLLCDRLQRQWTQAALASGASEIRIVRDEDDESAPIDHNLNFQYLESDYLYAKGIPHNLKAEKIVNSGFMQYCSCKGACSAANDCECIISRFENDANVVYDTYDDDGLMINIPDLQETIVECNANCKCNARTESDSRGKGKRRESSLRRTCGNRVAQQPRQYPIEIFKTDNRGWGARSTIDIPKGAVIGLYTGKVFKRTAKEVNKAPQSSYCYDLTLSEYTVSAYDCGNWTRFVNHSCEPVVQSVPIVYDTVMAMEDWFIPKLAYVALGLIPAGQEITLDYDPNGLNMAKKNTETYACGCGAKKCRGRIVAV